LCYVRIPNCSENDYVTVLNYSLIRGGEAVCRRPDSFKSRKTQYGIPRVPGLSPGQASHEKTFLKEMFQSLHMAKKVFSE
jgi:hypothetical protein